MAFEQATKQMRREMKKLVPNTLTTTSLQATGTPLPTTSPSHRAIGSIIYDKMLQIADNHNINQSDFDYFLTVSSPDNNHRLFYPYHPLSRQEAQQID
jgi:hypothetical protein